MFIGSQGPVEEQTLFSVSQWKIHHWGFPYGAQRGGVVIVIHRSIGRHISKWEEIPLPSGELTFCHGKSLFFNGKIHYKWPFSIAMLVHQRVDTITAQSQSDAIDLSKAEVLCQSHCFCAGLFFLFLSVYGKTRFSICLGHQIKFLDELQFLELVVWGFATFA